jgi:hypothetical protein
MEGLQIFLQSNFPGHRFRRCTPIRPKPGPRPGIQAMGHTGSGLSEQIGYFLPYNLRDSVGELILVIDDLDCQNAEARRQQFAAAIRRGLAQAGEQPAADRHALAHIAWEIGLAAPEIEAWLVADWQHTFAADRELRQHEVELRRELRRRYETSRPGGDIERPESFSELDPLRGACREKLSEVIQGLVRNLYGLDYSKAEHSGRMLKQARAEKINAGCAEFRSIYRRLMP